MITEKQKRTIAFIENTLEIKFEGETFDEAFKFIGNNLKNAQFCANMEKQIGLLGVPVYSSYHSFEKDTDETYFDHRDSVAEVTLKGDILRGKKPIDALLDFQENLLIEDQD